MDKDIFDIIDQKEFGQLNSNELKEISDFCSSESEFNAIKNTISGAKMTGNGPKLTTRNSTKDKLDVAFANQYANNRKYVSYYWKPMAQIASILLVVLASWYFFNENKVTDKVQMASESNVQPKENIIESNKLNHQDHTHEVTSNVTSTHEKTAVKVTQNRSKSTVPITTHSPEVAPKKQATNDNSVLTYSTIQPAIIEVEEVSEMIDTKVSKKQQEQTFKSFSTPALSVNDIAVDPSKKPAKAHQTYIAPISKQQNVLQYLSLKY